MAATNIEICSNALVLIGDKPISTFASDQGPRADVASNLFNNIRDATLRMHPWNSSRKRVSLAPLADAPAFEWSYQMQLPADFIRLVSIGETGENIFYEIEDGKILTDETEIKLKYIYRNEVVSSYDALLTQALIAHCAWAFAYPLAKSQALRDGMEKYLQQTLQQARTINGQEKLSETLGDEGLFRSRFTTTGGGSF